MAKDMNYPLPSISTLQKYARKIDLKHGILEDVLIFIGNIAKTFSNRDCECILSFDEMKVEKLLEYDPAADEVIGPHNYIQVIMARGLFRNWKQPIFIGFDTKMTREILMSCMDKLNKRGINVVAIVSDNCPANVSCWRELGATYTKPFFKHPVTEKNVYICPDAPHLLKLIRNWLIEHGFQYKQKHISSEPLHTIVKQRNTSEFTHGNNASTT